MPFDPTPITVVPACGEDAPCFAKASQDGQVTRDLIYVRAWVDHNYEPDFMGCVIAAFMVNGIHLPLDELRDAAEYFGYASVPSCSDVGKGMALALIDRAIAQSRAASACEASGAKQAAEVE